MRLSWQSFRAICPASTLVCHIRPTPFLLRLILNLWPPFLFAGIRVCAIDADFRSAEVELRMRPWNRNYVGIHFGGSLFAMAGLFWMQPTMPARGHGYVVLDEAGEIEFVASGRVRIRPVTGIQCFRCAWHCAPLRYQHPVGLDATSPPAPFSLWSSPDRIPGPPHGARAFKIARGSAFGSPCLWGFAAIQWPGIRSLSDDRHVNLRNRYADAPACA